MLRDRIPRPSRFLVLNAWMRKWSDHPTDPSQDWGGGKRAISLALRQSVLLHTAK